MFSNTRIDCIIIWGHGMKYFEDILLEIENNNNFEILKIIKHTPKSQKQLVREVYSFDYAPIVHLKSKTKYLLKVDKEVCFIFTKNLKVEEDLYGVGKFRHVESVTLKQFKENLRDKFNPYENGIRSHNHVIHATDNQTQTHHLLKYLGYNKGVFTFLNQNKLFNFPEFIEQKSNISILKLNYEELLCNIAFGESWNSFSLKEVEVKKSPQFQSLEDGDKVYYDYWKKFIGGPIKSYYSLKKFKSLKAEFKYLEKPYDKSYVIVQKHKDKYLILDGLHRSALHFHQGNTSIIACLIK